MPFVILYNLMVILLAGLIAGMISKRFRIPMVIGYLQAGALIGEGGIPGLLIKVGDIPNLEQVRTVMESTAIESYEKIEQTGQATPRESALGEGASTQDADRKTAPKAIEVALIEETADEKLHEVIESDQFQTAMIDELAHLGALFLLFSIGIHFAPSELFKMKKFLFVGGPLQMLGVIVPVTGIMYLWSGDYRIGFLVGCAAPLSSTVLVYKSLEEYGQASSPFGLRAVAVLLFQDMAISGYGDRAVSAAASAFVRRLFGSGDRA